MNQTLMESDQFLDRLSELFAANAKEKELGHRLSNAEHMLQSAAAAKNANAEDHLIAASLLHEK